MSEHEPAVLSRIEAGVGIITLNRPQKFNCISTDLMNGVQGTLETFEEDGRVRAVLLVGAGKVFCTGADLDEVMQVRESKDSQAAFISRIHELLRRLEASRLPVVAAVHGLALAGGLEIILACDVVFAADTARIGDQHVQYGLVPGGGGTQRLPRIVGLRRALDLMYSGRWLQADEAERWGLVNYVVPEAELQARALEYCQRLAERSRAGLASMKRYSRQGLDLSLDNGLRLEEQAVVEDLMGADVAEGLDAFRARRTPEFK